MLKWLFTGLCLLFVLLPSFCFAEAEDQGRQAAQSYIEQSRNSAFPQNIEFRLLAADVYIQSGFTVQAKEILESIPLDDLPSDLLILHRLLLAELALKTQQPSKALSHTYAIQNQRHSTALLPAYQLRLRLIRAKAYEALSQPIESLKERQFIESETSNTAILLKNRQDTWKTLTQLSTEQLKRLSAKDNADDASGWITLAIIYQQYQLTPEKLTQAIDGWKYQHPDHPAHDILPNHSNRTVQFKNRVKQVSLLLPLEGSMGLLGQAIKEGFLSGYQYADPNSRPEIKIYDTSTYQDITALYQKAVEEGADFIVGPLFKEEVRKLSTQPDGFFSVPLLALNQANETNAATLPSRFFQFALSPEQEAGLLAKKIIEQNKHYPILVVPNNDWGKRFAHTFDAKLAQLNGALIETIYTSSSQQNLGKIISQKFEIDSSQDRFRHISAMLGKKIERQPRRRQDLDSLVLAISPQQARQIKPLLDFHYAHDLPVYGSSNIYSGTPNANKDIDLNGIQFCDMPWFIVPGQTNYAQRGGQIRSLPEQQARLFAMGVDAFDLTIQLKQLSASPTASYPGMTGRLSLGENNIILRQLVWAEFKNGAPIRVK